MKRLPKFSGLMCTMMLALGALAFMATNPASAVAQCGVTVQMAKNCVTPKVVGEKVDCTITLTNQDACNNTYQINSGSDTITTSGGAVNDTGLPISAAVPGTPASGTPCAAGDPPTLPCTLAVGGSVTFRDNDYTIVPGDAGLGSLADTGTINMTDLCDADSTGCSSNAVNEQAPASTTVLSCSVTIDKQISCDEGATWTNADAATSGVVTGTCTGFTGDAIWVRYVVHNSGDVAITSCNVHDVTGSSPSSSGGTEYTQDYSTGLDNIASGGTVTTPAITVGSDGSTALTCDASGPNYDTAQVDCTCGEAGPNTNDYDTAEFSCESCSVQIDKQVNCASAGYVDVFSSDDSVNGNTPPDADTGVYTCTGYDAYTGHTADNIAVQYVIKNTGDDDLENCTTGETNTAITGSSTITGANTTFASGGDQTVGPFNNDCSPSLIAEELGGENTATIGCDCKALENNTKTRSVGFHDTAGFNCLAPGLNVTKVCAPQDGGVNNFTIDVSNSGGVNLTHCNVTDAYEPGVDCPTTLDGSAVDATSSLSPVGNGDYSINTSASLPQFSGSINGLTANACNQASVTCNIGDTVDTITQTSQDTCEVAYGCETRTPGYWKTHPEVASSVITAAGGTIQSCGLGLNNVLAGVDCSAIEDMCSLGQDAAKLGIDPTQANLIFQCAAAELNLAVTQQDGGNCGNTIPNSNLTFETCCGLAGACATAADPATLYACQQAVSAFNAQYDTTTLTSGSVLNTPGANSANCREANGNGLVNDYGALSSSCGGGRTYLEKTTGGGNPHTTSTTNSGKALGKNK